MHAEIIGHARTRQQLGFYGAAADSRLRGRIIRRTRNTRGTRCFSGTKIAEPAYARSGKAQSLAGSRNVRFTFAINSARIVADTERV